MGVVKLSNNWNDMVKGDLTRQTLQNSKGYAKSPGFRRGYLFSGRSLSLQTGGKLDP